MKHFLLLLFIISSVTAFAQWNEQSTGFDIAGRGINQIVIIDENTVWATAYDGFATTAAVREFTRTTDGGNTWIPGIATGPPTTNNWSCLSAINADTAWGLFYKTTGNQLGGGLWRTNDGGATWTQQTVFGTSSFPDVVYFWDANTGVAVGDPIGGEYEIYTTVDGGTTWTAVSGSDIADPTSGEYALVRSFAEKNGTIWCGTTDGRVLRSLDKGKTWTAYSTGYDGYYVGSLTFASNDLGWLTVTEPSGAEIILLRTEDGGNTWTNLTTGIETHYEVAHVPNTEKTIVTSWQNTYSDFGSSYSLDGGDTWTEIDYGVQHTTVMFLNHFTGWNGGFTIDATTGGIFKYEGSFEPTGVPSLNLDNYKFSVYPNPSNGLFYIAFESENNSPITLTVTDVTGKVVYRNYYKDKSELWLRSFDLSSSGKGVYVMTLENAGVKSVQKLVVQ